jgi:hypothetical protein
MIAHQRILGLTGLAVLTAAAVHFSPAWTAKLMPVGGSTVSGTATVTATTPDSATASLSITGAKPGPYPWHVHSGKCGGGGSPVGSASAFPPLTVQSSGQGTAQATIAFKLVDGSPYSVNVHKSMSDMAPIACGDLVNGGTGMSTMPAPATPDTSMKPAKP